MFSMENKNNYRALAAMATSSSSSSVELIVHFFFSVWVENKLVDFPLFSLFASDATASIFGNFEISRFGNNNSNNNNEKKKPF